MVSVGWCHDNELQLTSFLMARVWCGSNYFDNRYLEMFIRFYAPIFVVIILLLGFHCSMWVGYNGTSQLGLFGYMDAPEA